MVTYLAFIAVYEDGMIPFIEDGHEGRADDIFWDIIERFLSISLILV